MPRSSHLTFRLALGDRLRSMKDRLSSTTTDVFFKEHPEWGAKFGDRGRRLCSEDSGYHLDFLAAAIETDNLSAFNHYINWAKRMLGARGIGADHLREHLDILYYRLKEHLDAEEAALVQAVLTQGKTVLSVPVGPDPATENLNKWVSPRQVYLTAILQGHRKAATTTALELLREGHALIDIYVAVLQESLYEVGRLWETADISVAIEHIATAITQHVMSQLYVGQPAAEVSRGRAIVTGIEGEYHQVGAQMVADVLESDGWNVQFLGSNVPHSAVLDAVRRHRADLVCISTTMLFSAAKAIRLVTDLRPLVPHSKVLVGGAAFRMSPGLWADIGADGYAPDLTGVLALTRQFGTAV